MYEKNNGVVNCKNKLHFLENGEIVFPNRGNLTFGYREYCLSLNMASLREERGRYMVHVCLENTEKPVSRGVKCRDYSKC